ncbi:daf-6 [Cordylochernes scorpioides]|uniref:Daf-6 n=1 Tax=Cordylochernes scorpioides TaxID=51811 RepID=A0ABY6KKC3_9ARAC|nr:daf-6 [Cordylochernes scorpioides]
MCQKKLLYLSVGLTYCFRGLGSLVARRPWWFIIAPVIFTAVASIWCFKAEIDGDTVKLFGPSGSSYHRVRKLILHNFPLSKQEHYDIGRETKFISGYGRLLVETLDGGSLFRQHIVDEIFKIDRIVRSMAITDPKGKKWDYESLCARYYGTCFVNPTINLAEHLDEILRGEFKIQYPLELSKDQLQFHYYGATLSGVTLDSEGHVVNATKAQLVYFLDNVDPEKEALLTTWEHAYLDLIDQIPLQYLRVCKMASSSYRDEFVKIGVQFLPLFLMTGVVMIIFCTLACLSTDPLVTKPWLGIFGCVSSLMGVMAGCGICLLAGLTFPPINFGVPFLLLAIGIDDTFIFLAAWRTTDPKDSVEKRLVQSYERSAVSVTLTSVTNCASFLACTSMPYLATRIFGIYSVVSCILVYLNQLTFMGGIMTLTGRLEAAGYHGIFPWVQVKKESGKFSIIVCITLIYSAL